QVEDLVRLDAEHHHVGVLERLGARGRGGGAQLRGGALAAGRAGVRDAQVRGAHPGGEGGAHDGAAPGAGAAPGPAAARSLLAGPEFAMRRCAGRAPAARRVRTTGPPMLPAPITATRRSASSGPAVASAVRSGVCAVESSMPTRVRVARSAPEGA